MKCVRQEMWEVGAFALLTLFDVIVSSACADWKQIADADKKHWSCECRPTLRSTDFKLEAVGTNARTANRLGLQ